MPPLVNRFHEESDNTPPHPRQFRCGSGVMSVIAVIAGHEATIGCVRRQASACCSSAQRGQARVRSSWAARTPTSRPSVEREPPPLVPARRAATREPVRTSATSKDCRSVKDDERHWKTPWASCQILKPDALRPPLIVHGPTSLSFEQAF